MSDGRTPEMLVVRADHVDRVAARAAALLEAVALVVLPAETVYGLAAAG